MKNIYSLNNLNQIHLVQIQIIILKVLILIFFFLRVVLYSTLIINYSPC